MHSDSKESREAEELFVGYLSDLSEGALAGAAFEEFVARHPRHEVKLWQLFEGYCKVRGQVAQGGVESSVSLPRGYELLEELGRGGYGRVFRARDLALKRDVAVKLLGQDARVSKVERARFLAEARTLAQLRHENIVTIYGVDVTEQGEIQLVLELIDGRTLQKIVETEGCYAPAEAAGIASDLCAALSAIHEKGLIHMDIKPGNVMRASGGRIVLLDFGFTRQASLAEGGTASPAGGTPPFMSPEIFEYRPKIGPATDIYSLGVLLYWIVSGHYPYEFHDYATLRERVLAGQATPLLDHRPDVDPKFAALVMRAMAREEAQRFPSAGAFAAALREWSHGTAAPQLTRRPLTPSRRTLLSASGLLGIGLAGAYALFSTLSSRFHVDLSFQLQKNGIDVPLAWGDRVKINDRLSLLAFSPEPFYLYVFSEDSLRKCFRLYPMSGDAFLPGRVTTRLPAPDPGKVWLVDTPGGGHENFFAIASASPNSFAEVLLAHIRRPTLVQEGVFFTDVCSGIQHDLSRGVGGVVDDSSKTEQLQTTLAALFGWYKNTIRATDRVMVVHLRLDHP